MEEHEYNEEVSREKEYTNKKVKLVEEMVDKKIDVIYNSRAHFNSASRSSKSHYNVIVNGDIPIRTAIDHELSHCREGSLDDKYWKPYKAIVETWFNKENIARGSNISAGCKEMAEQICHTAMNIIEDIRIESIDGYRFLGRQKSYDKLCIHEGNKWKENAIDTDIKTVEGYVLAERFRRTELIPDQYKAETHRIYEESKLQTIAGIHRLFSDWLNDSLGKQIRNAIDELEEKFKERRENWGCQTNLNSIIDKLKSDIAQKDKELAEQLANGNPPSAEQLKELEDMIEQKTKQQANIIISKDRNSDIAEFINSLTNTVAQDKMDKKSGSNSLKPITDKQMKSMLDKIGKTSTSKEKNSNKIALDKEKEKLGSGASPPDLSKGFDRLDPSPHAISSDQVKIYDEVVSDIRKIANTLKQKRKSSISDDGSDIDIELMLEAVKKGSNDFYINEEKTDGTSILISVDCSGSMRDNNRLLIARNLCATMFRSVNNLPTINMKVLLYGGADSSLLKTGVLEINNEKECDKIGIDSSRALTPTNDALVYSAYLMNKMKGKKKLLLFLTDGEPADYRRTSSSTLCEQARKSYNKIKSEYPNMVIKPIMIGSYSNDSITTIFGRDALFLNIESLSDFIKNEFKKEISKSF